jgi:hypothetical protein
VNDEKFCVILLRRYYTGFEASVHPLIGTREGRLSVRALVFSGTRTECETWTEREWWRVIETTTEAFDVTELELQGLRWFALKGGA